MTTATLTPLPNKRKRGRPAKRRKTMTEQPLPTKEVEVPPIPVTITKVQSHIEDIQLIDRNALWEDFTNRVKINNYEVSKVMEDLKRVVEASQPYIHNALDATQPYVDKAVNKFKELRSTNV